LYAQDYSSGSGKPTKFLSSAESQAAADIMYDKQYLQNGEYENGFSLAKLQVSPTVVDPRERGVKFSLPKTRDIELLKIGKGDRVIIPSDPWKSIEVMENTQSSAQKHNQGQLR
jgi:hypothetical protein